MSCPDSLPQLLIGVFAFWGLHTTHLLILVYVISAAYSLVATVLLNAQLFGEALVRRTLGGSQSSLLLSALSWAFWLFNLPLIALHEYLMEPLGRWLCNLPPRIMRGLRLNVPDPLYIFYFMALGKPEEEPPVRADRTCPCDCSPALLWCAHRLLARMR